MSGISLGKAHEKHFAAHVHEKHMGFELEVAHAKIVRLLNREPRDVEAIVEVIRHLKPAKLARAVADTFGCAWVVER